MATRQERREALERMTEEEISKLRGRWDGSWYCDGDMAATIKKLLRVAEQPEHRDHVDRMLNLPTDAEQQVQLQRDSVAAARSSAKAAWLSVIGALVAIIISVIALIKSFGS